MSKSAKIKPPCPAAKHADTVIARIDSTLPPIIRPNPSRRATATMSSAVAMPAFISLMLMNCAARACATSSASRAEHTLSSAATGQPLSSPSARIPARSSFASHCSSSAGLMPRFRKPAINTLAASRETPALPSRISGAPGATSWIAASRARS